MNLPPIFKGMKVPPVRRPFLGRLRANLLCSMFNAMMNARITRGATDDIFITSHGIVFQIKKVEAEESTSDADAKRYIIQSDQGHYLICHEWDGSVEGEEDIAIAKQGNARPTTAAENFSSLSYAPTYPVDKNHRVMTHDGTPDIIFNQTLYPPYAGDGIIHAVQSSNGTGVAGAPDYIEISPARRWDVDFIELDVCLTDGTPMKALLQSTQLYEEP